MGWYEVLYTSDRMIFHNHPEADGSYYPFCRRQFTEALLESYMTGTGQL